jgi:hypothetical protein
MLLVRFFWFLFQSWLILQAHRRPTWPTWLSTISLIAWSYPSSLLTLATLAFSFNGNRVLLIGSTRLCCDV